LTPQAASSAWRTTRRFRNPDIRAALFVAISSEADNGSHEENASKQESKARFWIQSEPKAL
jgi:hypothetical protein